MALDFPSSPTLNQLYPSSPIVGVPTYRWDGEKWVSQLVLNTDAPADGFTYGRRNNAWERAVRRLGDTMTGNLTLSPASGSASSIIAPVAGQLASTDYYDGATIKWQAGKKTTNEYQIFDNSNSVAPILITGGGTKTLALGSAGWTIPVTGSMTISGALTVGGGAVMVATGQQIITGGFRIAPYNIGTVSSGTITPDAFNGNYQYYSNGGAHTVAAPANDCAMDILVTNGATAGGITFSGFTVASGNTGDPLTATSGQKFIISIRRINGVATYVIKALQ